MISCHPFALVFFGGHFGFKYLPSTAQGRNLCTTHRLLIYRHALAQQDDQLTSHILITLFRSRRRATLQLKFRCGEGKKRKMATKTQTSTMLFSTKSEASKMAFRRIWILLLLQCVSSVISQEVGPANVVNTSSTLIFI